MHHLSLPELVNAAENYERQSRSLYRLAHDRSGLQRASCLTRAQHEAHMALECRRWAGCEGN